jgi:hypothetical protein
MMVTLTLLPPHIFRYFAQVAPENPPPITTMCGVVVSAAIPGVTANSELAPTNFIKFRLEFEWVVFI